MKDKVISLDKSLPDKLPSSGLVWNQVIRELKRTKEIWWGNIGIIGSLAWKFNDFGHIYEHDRKILLIDALIDILTLSSVNTENMYVVRNVLIELNCIFQIWRVQSLGRI